MRWSCSSLGAVAFIYTFFALASARPQPRDTTATKSLLNVAYFGQGPDQPSLSTFCSDSSLDIIPIAFVNGVSSSNGGYPAMNFGNVCGSSEYFYDGTTQTASFTKCAGFVDDIPQCQSAGKKIFISIGGALADVDLASQEEAVAFADQLWDIFGPYNSSYTGPRPFGSASVDGFDFDLESGTGAYWVDVATTLRSKFSDDSSKTYALSAAPQCLTSDIAAPMIQGAYFDHIWVQYFNTPQCSARNFFDEGDSRSGIGYDTWLSVLEKSANPNVPLFIGLPGSSTAVPTYPDNVLSVAETTELIKTFACTSTNSINSSFGGIMLWDATYARNNDDYAASIKLALESPCGDETTQTSTTVTTTSTASTTSGYATSTLISTTSTFTSTFTFTSTPISTSASTSTSTPISTTSSSTTLVASSFGTSTALYTTALYTTPSSSSSTTTSWTTSSTESSSTTSEASWEYPTITPVLVTSTLQVTTTVQFTTLVVSTTATSALSSTYPTTSTTVDTLSSSLPVVETTSSPSPSTTSSGWDSVNWGPDFQGTPSTTWGAWPAWAPWAHWANVQGS